MGISRADVTVLGELTRSKPVAAFGSKYLWALIPSGYLFKPSAVEIAEVLEVPIASLRDTASLRVETRWEEGAPVTSYSYAFKDHLIFGATARILQHSWRFWKRIRRRRNTELSTAPLTEIEIELAKLPPAVLEAYQEANPSLEAAFGEEELALWAKEGLTIGTQTVRSWESAVEYYRVGPQVARFLSFPSFMRGLAVGPIWPKTPRLWR